MSPKEKPQNILTLPPNAGRTIVRKGALRACPPLGTDQFIKFCKDRGLSTDRERLIRLERLGFFSPLFRVRTPPGSWRLFSIPPADNNDWFQRGWAWDTTSVKKPHTMPDPEDRNHEGYYSIFQIDHLNVVLSLMSLQVPMDRYLDTPERQDVDWNKSGRRWLKIFRNTADALQEEEHRRSRALLCQFISNRYYPQTQGDQRTILMPLSDSFDNWISVNTLNLDWYEYVRRWTPRQTERLFQLTPEKLRHAYEGLAVEQKICDPMEQWYQLIQFISVSERHKLKGDALRAESLRAGAHMLRLLHKDLYKTDLPHPNEVGSTIRIHVPELEVRQDTRRYLEFVANHYGVNPQPKLCLLVEGRTEERAIEKIFESWFGMHPGKLGIEIVSLGGVDNATGGKPDRYRAILRLVDYLHHHQTITFLILDKEGYATRLKSEARKAKSIHPKRRHVTRLEYIKIWRTSFELANFSASEIADALSEQAGGTARFTGSEVAAIRKQKKPNARLSELYKKKTDKDIAKLKLVESLVDRMMANGSRRKIESRPIVQTLKRVVQLAACNPFPIMLDVWARNQASKILGTRKVAGSR